jgi:ATP-dependent Lon protease
MSSEAVVIRNYVDWILSVPWTKESKDRVSLVQAEKILDSRHSGLQKTKDRIIEFLAAKKFNPTMKYTPTICLVGAPGVGKTSLGKSVAQALGREFIRISLGGTRDEAEIRGHRRTYIGALPGKIIQAMRKASTINPVILLDEIDKISTDLYGDPASALLEVLDPEQNNTFVDNFMEVEYDLSKVMFLATANHYENIPHPLFDRMEVIFLSGYTNTEKLAIAHKFLLPKHLKEHGLTAQQCKISKTILTQIIAGHTKESGVRQLERIIAKLIRKVIQLFLKDKSVTSVTVTEAHCLDWLGNAPFKRKPLDPLEQSIGFATGLAWTELGGEVLEIETTTVPGKGDLTLTGQLGEVMRESAQAALSYIRAHAAELGINESLFASHDIHIHVPEGATPKDGPSAGITICTALISALTNKPIKPAIAMTGEITLRGRVLAVGGLKEKILAAQQHGVSTILLPEENKDEILKIKKELDKDIDIQFVATMNQVIEKTIDITIGKQTDNS